MGYIYTKSGKLAKRLYFGAVLLFEGLYYTFKNRVLADGGTFLENELPTISQDASLVLTPNAYKAGKLYSAVPNDGTGDFTVDRNCPATYIGQDGLIKTALANVPRIDWSSGEAALLVEPQRTNLFDYSDFLVGWDRSNAETVFNSGTSPDGMNNAIKLIETNTTANHFIRKIIATTASSVYTFSLYAKYTGNPYIILYVSGAAKGKWFNIQNGTIIKDYVGTPISSVIEPFLNGWYRLSITVLATTSSGAVIYTTDDINTTNTTGDGISGVLIYGAQLEQASTASSHIPTAGVAETRLADDISVPTPAGVTSITETIDGVEQTPITTIPATYSLPVGNINKVTML